MRDPARIDRMIEKLRAAWKRRPEQRLGQLVSSACWLGLRKGDVDPFSIEDDIAERGLEALAAPLPEERIE